MSNYLAIDWGTKRIGLARGNSRAGLAAPLESVVNDLQLEATLRDICQREAITGLVIGLPRNLEGKESVQARKVRRWGEQLGSKLGVPVVFQDETLTSTEAAQTPSSRFDIHSLAAVIILQDHLDNSQ